MQVGIFNCLFIFVIAALNNYVIVASIIVIAIRNSINCAAQPLTSYRFQTWCKKEAALSDGSKHRTGLIVCKPFELSILNVHYDWKGQI